MSVSDKQLSRMPNGLSFEQAGSLPLVALTAVQVQYQALILTLAQILTLTQPLPSRWLT